MFKVAIAHSLTASIDAVASSLVHTAMRQLDGQIANAALLFSSFGLDHQTLLDQLAQLLPGCPLVGGSSYGEVSRQQGYRLGSSLLILFASDSVKIRAGIVRNLRFDDASHNQAMLAQQLVGRPDSATPPVLGLIFPDGVGLDGESMVKAFSGLFPATRFFGGATAEDFNMHQTCQFFNREVLHQSVPYMLFYGPLRYTWAVTQGLTSGWRAVGERLDAHCDGRHLQTINQRPAVDYLAARYRLEGGVLSVCHPFVIYPDRQSEEHYFRDVIRYSTDTGALESLQLLPADCQVQLTEPDPAAILAVSRQNIQQALAHFPGAAPPAVALWFSCVSRALVLQADAQCEFSTAIANVPAMLPVAGFYTYGEIAPTGQAGASAYHSSTLVTLLLGEEPRPSVGMFAPADPFTSANLQQENRRLAEQLVTLQTKVAALEQALASEKEHARFSANSRAESATWQRALALELLCTLIDRQFDELKHHALKGSPPRLNRSGLARLINKLHLQQTGQPFPLSEAQLARLLLQNHSDD